MDGKSGARLINSNKRRGHLFHRAWFQVLCILGLAFLVRLALYVSLKPDSYMLNVRVSDSSAYHRLAEKLLEGGAIDYLPYWQAPLYSYVILPIYAVFGPSLEALHIFHGVMGIFNCLLIYALARSILGHPAGLVALLFASLYMPFALFDLQPHPANLVVMLCLLSAWTFILYRRGGRTFWWIFSAFVLGMGIVAHGMSVFCVPVMLLYAWKGRGMSGSVTPARNSPSSKRGLALVRVLVYLGFASILPALVSTHNSRAAQRPMFISSNSGINLYLGNHPDYEETYGKRGVLEWESMLYEADMAGYVGKIERNRYFTLAAWKNLKEYPVKTAGTLLRKLMILLSASETSRNFPIWPLRRQSGIMAVLQWDWRVGNFVILSFPSGVIIPLSLAGLIVAAAAGKKERGTVLLPAWLALSYAVGMLVFFPCTRYRLPAVALAMVYTGVLLVPRSIEVRLGSFLRWNMRVGWISFLFLFVLLNLVAPAFSPRDPAEELAQHIYHQGLWFKREGERNNDPRQFEKGIEMIQRSLEIDPDYFDPLDQLSLYYHLDKKDNKRARDCLQKLVFLTPAGSPLRAKYQGVLQYINMMGEGASGPSNPFTHPGPRMPFR